MTSSLGEERLAQLRQAKLAALVGRAFPDDGPLDGGPFPGGAAVVARPSAGGATATVLVEAPGARVLGPALIWAVRQGVDRLRLVLGADDPGPEVPRATEPLAPRVARQGARVTAPVVEVWRIVGTDLEAVAAAPVPERVPPPSEAALDAAAVLRDAGLEVVVEAGIVRGEVLGLEVARIVERTGDASAETVDLSAGPVIEVGIGRFDREISALMHAGAATAETVTRAAELVRRHRAPGRPTHPLRDLVPERWVRRAVLEDPTLVGAVELAAADTTLAPRSLRERQPAAAVGTDVEGRPLVVVASAGVDPDLVPLAADARDLHDPEAALVLVVAGAAPPPSAAVLADRLERPARFVVVPEPWRA